MKTRWFRIAGLLTGSGLILPVLPSQAVKAPARHAGEAISFTVRFDGKDAAEIELVSFSVDTRDLARQGQVNLMRHGQSPWVGADKSGMFHPKFTIPENLASGEYRVVFLAAVRRGTGRISIEYPGAAPPVRIENDARFEKPRIIVRP